MPRTLYANVYERLIANSEVVGSCWVWTGGLDRKGYGRLSLRKPGRPKPVGCRAHRVMAEYWSGRTFDPDTETIEHTCWNRACINPDHLGLCTRVHNSELARARKLGLTLIARVMALPDRVEEPIPWDEPGRVYEPHEPCPF